MAESNSANFKLIKKGDFVISLRSFQGGLEYSSLEGLVSPAYHVIHPKLKISESYFRHFFKSYWFIGHLAITVIGIRDGKQVAFKDFSYLKFPFPAIKEQKRIGQVIDVLDENLFLYSRNLRSLQLQKKALMQQLLTGKTRVKVTL
jgi:type I restriction enzyme S subunit